MHLLLPLLASLLFVCGLIFVKRAGLAGVSPVTTMFLTNQMSCLLFSTLWFFGGPGQPWTMLWQPAIISGLFMIGLMFTLLAVYRGDVSIATPVFGIKVVFVAFLLTFVGGHSLPLSVWSAAVLATAGIGLIQWTGRDQPRRVIATILLALCAATSFATFDVLVQRWAPAWGAGRFLPIVYAIVGVLSLGLIPWVQWKLFRDAKVRRILIPGALLVSLQALCIVVAVAVFGDAARVNVVYAMRGLFGVTLAWLAAQIWGGDEAKLPASVLTTRLMGALMLTTAVVLVILS